MQPDFLPFGQQMVEPVRAIKGLASSKEVSTGAAMARALRLRRVRALNCMLGTWWLEELMFGEFCWVLSVDR